MSKFVEKNKKWLLLVAIGLIALAWLCAGLVTFTQIRHGSVNMSLFGVERILRELVAGMALLVFAVGGFLYWKTGKQFFLIPIGCALVVVALGVYLAVSLLELVIYGNEIVFVSGLTGEIIPFLLFTAVAVFSFVKIKGAVVPIACGAAGVATTVWSYFNAYSFSYYKSFGNGFGIEVVSFATMLFYLGLTLLVFLFLWERCNPKKEAVADLPVEEEV